MSKLDELIAKLCPEGVDFLPLKIICDISKGVQFNKANMNNEGTYPVINGGITPSGYIEQYNQDENTITISQGGASAGYVNWMSQKFWAGAHCYVLKPYPSLDNRYLFHFVKSKEYKLQECQYGAGIPALGKSTLEELKIPVPPIEVQREIVRILDNFTELTAELTARKQQYEYYRDKLLRPKSFECKEMTILDMLCQPITDGPHETPRLVQDGVPFLSAEAIVDSRLDFTHKRGYITKEYDDICAKKYKPQRNDVFMCKSGSTTGKVAINESDNDFNIWSPLAALRVNEHNSAKYLFYLLQSEEVQSQVKTQASHGSQPNLSMRKLEKFKVRVPELRIQERIVDVLDNFERICSDLNIGLPAEIEARQKQYEFYRDQLLTFAETGNSILTDRQTDRQTNRT